MRATTRLLQSAAATAIVLAAVAGLAAQPAAPVARRIAIFGSSVANGTGDESGRSGYAGILRDLLQPRGWEVVNQSRGGDNTAKLMSRFDPEGKPEAGTRYLVPARAGYVVIGLSLGNEGIRDVDGTAAKDARYEQYMRGIQAVVARSRAAGMMPIVTLCYTRNDFTDVGVRLHPANERARSISGTSRASTCSGRSTMAPASG